VVTGRGRSEKLQSAPIAVTAFSEKAMSDAHIKDVSDFIALTPNVSIVQSQSVGLNAITIRGISQVRNGEPPVSVVTDGVQQIDPYQFTTDLFNIQQIEVLRGPQGALYGRDAIGGAMIITTKQPTNQFHESIDAEVGNGNNYHVEASVAGPIIPDKLFFSLAGNYHDFGGLLKNVYLNEEADRSHDRAIHAQLKANVTDNFTVDFHANYDYTTGGADNYQYQSTVFSPPGSCFTNNPFGGPAGNANTVSRSLCAYDLGSSVRSIADVSVRLQETTPWAIITDTLSAIHVGENDKADEFPYTASLNVDGVNGSQTQWLDKSAFQNDFRIASPDTGRFKWMAGAYVVHTTYYLSGTNGFDEGLGILSVFRTPRPSSSINPTTSFFADNNNNLAYAFYGNLSYEIIDGLTADFGYRYDNDNRRQEVNPLTTSTLPAGCTTTSGVGPCSLSHDFNQGQPKFTLSYKPNRDLLLFADYGIGFRSGQFNQYGVAQAAAAATPPTLGVSNLVKAEVADTAEAGFKSTLLDGKLHLNATAFYTQDHDPFYFLFVGSVGAQVLVNIDQVNLYGAELEADYTPTKGLNLFLDYGYTHSSVAKYTFDPADAGKQAPYTPDQTATLGAQYRTPITDQLGLFTRGEIEYHGKQYWDPEDSTPRNAFTLINLQAGIEKLGGPWSVVAFVKNLTDKAYNAEYVDGGFAQPAEPRTYGVEVKASF